ncbi:MAG: hypothetical protein ACOYBW_11350 [Fluviibacter phosphoraccumulans]
MIVRFFKTGLSRGEAPVNYLLREDDHKGDTRYSRPEILEGNPDLTIRLINDCSRVHKYASGVLAFRPDEQVSPKELSGILDRFREVIAPGISPEQYQCLFVLHKDPMDPKTGNHPFHVHFVIPMTFLAGETYNGKSLAGKRFNPHPPGQKSQEIMSLFAATVNHDHGWKQVVEDPMRLGIDSFWRKIDGQSNLRKIDLLGKELTQRVQAGSLRNRNELVSFIENDLGCEITRNSDTYISVRLPHMTKAIRLKGKLFEAATDYAREFSTHSLSNSRTMSTLTVPEYEQAKTKLNQLLEERKPVLLGYRPKTSTTTKETNDGRQQQTSRTPNYPRRVTGQNKRTGNTGTEYGVSLRGENRRNQREHSGNEKQHQPVHAHISGNGSADKSIGGSTGRRVGQRITANSTRPKPEPQNATQRSRSHPEHRTGGGLSATTNGENRTGNSQSTSQSLPASKQTQAFSGFVSRAVTAADLDEEIRKLGIALNYASYEGQSAIQNQINVLVGRKEHLPRPK